MSVALRPASPTFGRSVLGGFFAGIVAAVLANIALFALQAFTGLAFAELNPVSVTIMSIVPATLGGVLYHLSRRTGRPGLWYAVIALVLATLDSIMVSLQPLAPGFDLIANPLHYVVALTAVILTPRFANRS